MTLPAFSRFPAISSRGRSSDRASATVHGFAAGEQVLYRIGSDVYAYTVRSVTAHTVTTDLDGGTVHRICRGKYRPAGAGQGFLVALKEGEAWSTRLDPDF